MSQSNSYFFCGASVLLLKAKTYWSDKKRVMRPRREMASRQKLKTINVSTAIDLNRLKPAKWERRARSSGGSQLHLCVMHSARDHLLRCHLRSIFPDDVASSTNTLDRFFSCNLA